MRFLKTFLLIVLMLLAAVGGGVWRVMERRIFPEPEGGSSSKLNFLSEQGTVNVLLVGLDEVDGGRRSDAVALAVFDKGTQSIRVSSIPRDSRVLIEGRGWDKVNHAYAYGGVDLLKRTVENLSGVPINYFVIVNYDGFPRIIDLLGGVEVDVEKKMEYRDYSAKLFIDIPKGLQHMNGKTALEYVRFRHDPLGDIGRVQRQQNFLSIVMEKLKSPTIILKVPALVEEALKAVNTDLSLLQAIELAQFANSLPPDRIEFFMAPGKAAYIGNLSYWVVDIQAWSIMLAPGDTSPSSTNMSSPDLVDKVLDSAEVSELVSRIGKIGILNGDGAIGLGKRASQIFQKLGVDVGYTGNAKHFDYHASNVVYPKNGTEKDRQAAEALAKLCGINDKALVRRADSASMVSIVLGHDKETVFKRLEFVNP